MLLSIAHNTTYRYARPVEFGPHLLMVRAIEGHDVQIRRSGLGISAPHRIRWHHDVFDNSVATVECQSPASELRFSSTLLLEQFNTDPFDFLLHPEAVQLPFVYNSEDQIDLTPFLHQQHPEDSELVRAWIQPFLSSTGTAPTLECFTALTQSVPSSFQHRVREEPGVQPPSQTLSQRTGSCRDFALLLMEAARQLGVAARYVSGYLCRADAGGTLAQASDATHAWTELYLPGAGWKGFDPACGILAAEYHIRTAVTRTPQQAVPVAGSFIGAAEDYLGMEVSVDARKVDEQP